MVPHCSQNDLSKTQIRKSDHVSPVIYNLPSLPIGLVIEPCLPISLIRMIRAWLPLWNRVSSADFTHYFAGHVKNIQFLALAGVAQLERGPLHQKAGGSLLSQGTYLGWGFNLRLGHEWEATNQCFSLTSLFLSLPSSLSKINKHIFLKKI